MGILKIRAKYNEVQKKKAMVQTFSKAIKDAHDLADRIGDEMTRFEKKREDLLSQVEKLDALGVKAFEDYKKHVVAQVQAGGQLRKLPTFHMNKEIETQQEEASKDFEDWLKGLAGPFPKELKSGMTFYFKPSTAVALNALMTILSDPKDGEIEAEFTNFGGNKSRHEKYKMANVTPRNFVFLKI